MRLVLVRHGQTTANVAGALDTGEPGELLTDLGAEQAAGLVERLEGRRIDAIFTSPLTRTRQTAAPLAAARGIEPVVLAGFREIIAGDLEMRTDRDSVILYHEVASSWAHGDLARRMPGAENGEEVFARFGAAVARARRTVGEDGTAVVVAHGAIIRTWAAHHARNVTPAFATSRILENTGRVVLDETADGWRVRSWMEELLEG